MHVVFAVLRRNPPVFISDQPDTISSPIKAVPVRVDHSTLSPDSGTCDGPPAIRLTAFNAQPPNLPPAPLMDADFAAIGQLVRRRRPHIRFLFIGSSLGVFGITNGTTEQITQYLGTEDQCISGCTPKLFQYLANNGMKRAVLLMGTYDVLGSEPCGGGPENILYADVDLCVSGSDWQ
jgi:hypothetical protein